MVVIYIVLGVLYESTIHPITILSTLPSAGIGALLALMLAGSDLSLVALVGIVLLMGIVKKNAIMMIDFAIEAERDARPVPAAAIEEACLLRFRPIMMTTMAALLGALPLVLEHGSGSELRFPLGVTIVGGLLLSQLLTLYTTPVIYLTSSGCGCAGGHRPAPCRSRRRPSDFRHPCRLSRAWPLARGGGVNFSAAFIHRPVATDPARDRAAARGLRRLPLPARRAAAQRRHPHHRGVRRPARRRSRDHGQLASPPRWNAAWARSRASPRSPPPQRSAHRDRLQFDIDRDIDGAAHDVQAAINAATADLPADLPTRPYYRKFNPADAPIMTIALTSDTLSTAQVYDAADTILGQRLSPGGRREPGQVNGAEKPAVRVRLDPARWPPPGCPGRTSTPPSAPPT